MKSRYDRCEPAARCLCLVLLAAVFLSSCAAVQPVPVTPSSAMTETNPAATSTAAPTVEPTASPTPTGQTKNINIKLAAFLADLDNGRKAAERALNLNGGDWHNACVYVVSEALRRVGCEIPDATNYTPVLAQKLKALGFVRLDDLTTLKPGDICFTTDESGRTDGIPTHTFVFLAWADPGIMLVFDNQVYDYKDHIHTRPVAQSFHEGDRNKPKEATCFFMRAGLESEP